MTTGKSRLSNILEMNDIYTAQLAGYNLLYGNHNEKIAVLWPCGKQTKFSNIPTLYDLGNAIAAHGEECKECFVGAYRPPGTVQ